MASKKLVDDISILAVEKCLMTCVPGLFTRDMVDNMTEKEMSFLARETHDADLERTWCEKKRDVLHRALRKLRTVSSPDYMYGELHLGT